MTTRALIQRINRKLAENDQKLVKLRGKAAEEFGEYVIVPVPSVADVAGHGEAGPLSRIEKWNIGLDKLGRELGVLRTWETLAST